MKNVLNWPLLFPIYFRCIYPGCGKDFTLKQNLNKHVKRTHESNKPVFKCTHCDKLFHKNLHLKSHLYTHTGIPLFKLVNYIIKGKLSWQGKVKLPPQKWTGINNVLIHNKGLFHNILTQNSFLTKISM